MQSLEGTFREAVMPEDPKERRKIQYGSSQLMEPIRKQVNALAAANAVGLPLKADFIRANGKIETVVYFERDDFLRRLWQHFLSNPLGDVHITAA